MKKDKTPANIALFKQTAEKLGLTFTKMPTKNNKHLFSIASADRFYLGSWKSPGFYPEARRWGGVLTGNKQLTQDILKRLGFKTIQSTFLTYEEHPSFKSFYNLAQEKYQRFPVILKPNNGMDGRGIKYVADMPALKRELKFFYKNRTTVILQPIITDSEYRILIINGKVELVHSKDFRSVKGDGKKDIQSLLGKISEKNKNNDFIKLQYTLTGYTRKTILGYKETFGYHIVKDSSARHYQFEKFPKDLLRWSQSLVHALSIDTVAIDLFVDGSLENSDNYTIIELNSNPGLSHYYTACKDSVQPERICEKVLRDFFKIK